ncbi:MAG: arsenate reductase family protein [Ruminococcus sp.]|nr:arsenate reductase family protein [Ruminococcus sp.]
MLIFIEYPKCTTCKRAKAWLDEAGIEYTDRNIKDENPTIDELREWYAKSKLPLKRFFNTSGMLYKQMSLKDKLTQMSEEEQLELLSTDGMLVKRPIIINDDTILVGFRQDEWEHKLL